MRRFFHASALTRYPRSSNPKTNCYITRPPLEERLRPEQQISYFTEQVRLNKAIVCLLQEKLVHEFPQLKDYAVKYEKPSQEIQDSMTTITRYGLVFPGSDLHPHAPTDRKCTIKTHVGSLIKTDTERQTLIAIAGDSYDSDTQSITVTFDRFPAYSQNKQWLMDVMERMVESAKLCDFTQDYEKIHMTAKKTPKKIVQFPESWKRPDLVEKEQQVEFKTAQA